MASAMMVMAADMNDALARWHSDKFSMFIHFGLYSELGGVWNGRNITYGYSEQIQSHAGIYSDVYAEVAERFDPSLFNADAIADLAVAAGMRSIVITSKHHDGFCLWHTATTDFNAWDATPVSRDFIAELSAACERKGIKFGLYFSLIDWHFPYGHPITSGNADPVTPQHHELNMRQVRELLTSYGPISELWFDMGSLTPDQSADLYDLVHALQPDCMVSGRLGNDCYDFCVMSDNSFPDGTLKTPWQVPASMFNQTWGYRSWQERGSAEVKYVEKLKALLGTVSHGGNYLLNIGPKGDGSVVEFEQDVLLRMGSWLSKNGDAVYGTEPYAWPGSDAFGYCTTKGKDIFVTPSGATADTLVSLNVGASKLLMAVHLDDGTPVQATCKNGKVQIRLSAGDVLRAIKLSFDKPVAEPAPAMLAGSALKLDCTNAVPDYSYSCFDYYSNYKSVIGYNWYLKRSLPSRISISYPVDYRQRRITLGLDSEVFDVDLSDGILSSLLNSDLTWGDLLYKCINLSIAKDLESQSFTPSDGTWSRAISDKVSKVKTSAVVSAREVESANETDIVIEVTAGNALGLLVNGRQVTKHLNDYGCPERTESYIIHLQKGKNTIVAVSYILDNKEIPLNIQQAASDIYVLDIDLPANLRRNAQHHLSVKANDKKNEHSDIELSNLQMLVR